MKTESIDYTSPEFAYSFGNAKFNVRRMVRNRTNKKGLTKVLIEVQKHTYKGTGQYETEMRRISTDIWIYPKHWNQKKEIIIGQESDIEYKNNKILEKYAIVQKFVSSYGQQIPDSPYAVELHLEVLSDFFPSRKENRKCLVDYIEDYVTFRKGQKTPYGTLKEFKSLKNRLKAFDDYNKKKTYFEDINLTWSDDFESFLKNSAKYGSKENPKVGYADGTVGKTYTILVTVLNHFYNRRKQLEINLTDDFKIKSTIGAANGFKRGRKSKNDANPLTKEQLDALYNHQFSEPHLQLIQDRFLWQCYTGLRFGTAFIVTQEHIRNGWLYIKPSKTIRFEVRVEQPLNSVAIELLKKYNYDMTLLKITNQAYNRELKDMFKILQKEYPALKYKNDYGTYCSRDTFITRAVQKGANWKDILRWVGQSSYSIMDRYIKPEDKQQEKKVKTIFPKPQKPKN